MAERTVGHAEKFCSFDLNTIGAAKGFLKKALLEAFNVDFEIESLFGKIREGTHPGIGCDTFRQMLRRQFIRRFENKRPLHRVLELAYIARPIVGLEFFQGFISDPLDLFAHRYVRAREKMTRKERNVVPPMPQRRQLEWNDADAVKQVLAKLV